MSPGNAREQITEGSALVDSHRAHTRIGDGDAHRVALQELEKGMGEEVKGEGG